MRSETERTDPMNGNLRSPWYFLFLHLEICSLALIMFVFSIIGLRPANGRAPSSAEEIQTAFSSYERLEREHGTLLLYSAERDKPFRISNLSCYEVPLPSPDSLCSGERYIVLIEDGSEAYTVYAISTADTQKIISVADCNTASRNARVTGCVIFTFLSVLFFLFSLFRILVGRYPERFPVRFGKLMLSSPFGVNSTEFRKTIQQKRKTGET